jgi:hypothetical protein
MIRYFAALVFGVALADHCTPFTCRDVERPDKVCGEMHEDYYEVFACPKFHKCKPTHDFGSLEGKRICVPDLEDAPPRLSLPGESCSHTSDCVKHAICEHDTCYQLYGNQDGECQSNADCNIGLFCDYGSCQPEKQAG